VIQHNGFKVTLLLVILFVCLLTSALHHQSHFFRVFEAMLLLQQWILLVCVAVWCGTFIFLTFNLKDFLLIGLLVIALIRYFIGYAAFVKDVDAITFLFSMTLGKGTRVMLKLDGEWQTPNSETALEIQNSEFRIQNFLVGLVVLLAFFIMVPFGHEGRISWFTLGGSLG